MPLAIKEEDLKDITKKVYALYATHGFDSISMDEISRQSSISKATLYRYFTSKEDIIRGMVQTLVTQLDSVQFTGIQGISDVVESIQQFYVKSILAEALSGSNFLTDLKHKFPDSYEVWYTAMNALQDRFEKFFRQAVEKGYCKDLSFTLIRRQFMNMLPTIIDMDFLERNHITLTGALKEYYCMFLCQVLVEEYLYIVDEEKTYSFTGDLANVLLNDCFIDSIRR